MSARIHKDYQDYLLAEQVICYLREHAAEQPAIEDVAQDLGINREKLSKSFKRWVGLSPKQFLQFVTLTQAKELLKESRSLLDTSYELGLSSPSRLHDLFVTFEAASPQEYRTGGEGIELLYGFHETPFGLGLISVSERGIAYLSFIDSEAEKADALSELKAMWSGANHIEDNARTKTIMADVFQKPDAKNAKPVHLLVKGTNFQTQVWRALISIPQGTVLSYGDIAKALGKPNSSRAVGSAIGKNNLAYIIPCHRVINESGIMSSYRWGSTRKELMLAREVATS